MKNLATIRTMNSAMLLTPGEKRIVDLISTAIIKKTFKNEKRNPLFALQQRQTKCVKHREARSGNKPVDES